MIPQALRAAIAGKAAAFTIDPRLRFQWENVIPPVVNLGCESDPGGFGRNPVARAVNVDIDLWKIPRFVCADAARLPFRDKAFATALLGDMLDHVSDPVSVLYEAVRVARKRIVATLPDELHPADYDPRPHVEGLRSSGLVQGFRGDPVRQYRHTYGAWTIGRIVDFFHPILGVGMLGSGRIEVIQKIEIDPPSWGIVIALGPGDPRFVRAA